MDSPWRTSPAILNGSFAAKGAHTLYYPAVGWPIIPFREQAKIGNPLRNPELQMKLHQRNIDDIK